MSANKVTLNPNWKVGTTAGSITNTNAGNVGIGNTTPVASLDVSGTVYLRGADANQGLFINSSGNVGIGTTSPGYKLDVSGSINASGFLSAGGEYSYFGRSSGGVAANFFGNSGATSQTILKIREPAGQTGNIFSWETNTPTTLGVIDASGNMGIGYASPGTAKLAINGNVGIGTTVPTNLLSLGSEAARTFWIERRNTVNNAGSNLIVEAGGSTNGMVSTVAVVEAGTGYNVNDVLTLALPSGGTAATCTVATLVGGAGTGVATVTLTTKGAKYTTGTKTTTVAPAGGTGCTISVATIESGTDKAGGDILIKSGISSGTGFSSVKLQAYTAGASSATDGTATTHLEVGNSKIGFLGIATPVVRQTSGANLTNSVTSGGTDDTIANYTDLVIYANDAAAIRNDIYQLSRKLKQVNDALRAYGLLT